MVELALILVDECGDDCEYGRYRLPEMFAEDEDMMEVWKERKVNKMFEEYPEASSWYWMDYGTIRHRAMLALRDEGHGWYDEGDE